MNNRKSILYLVLIIIAIIFIYNYGVNPLLTQYGNNNMGMHMRMNENFYNNGNSYWDFLYFLLLIFMALAIYILVEVIFRKDKIDKCSICGYGIEDKKWHKCPICGNNLEEKRK